MPALTWKEKEKQKTLYEIGYQFLVQNFHKFKQSQQIRVALDVIAIFNKDGTKTKGNQLIYIVNNGQQDNRTINAAPNPIEILPAQGTAVDTTEAKSVQDGLCRPEIRKECVSSEHVYRESS